MNALIFLGRSKEGCSPEDELVFFCRGGAGKPIGLFLIPESENEAINTVKTVSRLPGYSLRFVDTEVKVLWLYISAIIWHHKCKRKKKSETQRSLFSECITEVLIIISRPRIQTHSIARKSLFSNSLVRKVSKRKQCPPGQGMQTD